MSETDALDPEGLEGPLSPAPFPLVDTPDGRGGEGSLFKATCVAIVSDPEALGSYLACVGHHYDLGAQACVAAARAGRGRALMLLPAEGEASWASRGYTVKLGADGVCFGDNSSRGALAVKRTTHLYSESDLERTWSPSDSELTGLAGVQLRFHTMVNNRLLDSAFEKLGAGLSVDAMNALRLRHGVSPSASELHAEAPKSVTAALSRCKTVIGAVSKVAKSFDAALADALEEENSMADVRGAMDAFGPHSAKGRGSASSLRGDGFQMGRPAAQTSSSRHAQIKEPLEAEEPDAPVTPTGRRDENPWKEHRPSPSELVDLIKGSK
jgi:hypothetical protein